MMRKINEGRAAAATAVFVVFAAAAAAVLDRRAESLDEYWPVPADRHVASKAKRSQYTSYSQNGYG